MQLRVAGWIGIVAAALLWGCGHAASVASCPVQIPSDMVLEKWYYDMGKAVEQWRTLPTEQQTLEWVESQGLSARRMYTFSTFYEMGTSGSPFGFELVTPLSARGLHRGAAEALSSCTGYTIWRSVYKEGRTHYYFLFPARFRAYSDSWLADWALQTYPADFAVGGWWTGHNQGAGGDL